MADRKCIKCGCSEVLFDKATGRCVRQGCQCTGCVFPQGSESYAEMQDRIERERLARPVALVPVAPVVPIEPTPVPAPVQIAEPAAPGTKSPIEPEPTKPTETVN